jgi:negative regulator of flagellin synthesis FlgM
LKIDNSTPLPRSLQAEQGKNSARIQGDSAQSAAGPASVTRLSHTGGDASHDIDQARIGEIRQAIAEGRLEIDAGKIADGLIASVRAMLEDGAR